MAAADIGALEMHGTGTPLGAFMQPFQCISMILGSKHAGREKVILTHPESCVNCACAGDPIEVGAATAVLSGGSVSVRLTAAKARIGHAEPAAGSVGIVHVSPIPTTVEARCRLLGSSWICWYPPSSCLKSYHDLKRW